MRYAIEELDVMNGHDFEYTVADLLFHNGYRDVTVTQGSGDFGIDILARRKNVKYAIQCKRYKNTVGVKAVQEAGLGTDFYHCDAAAVVTNSTFTKQAINLAKTTGVRLWDRTFIEELIDNYDEEYDEIDPQFTQKYGSIINGIHNQPSVSEKAKKSDKGIELAKDIYAKNGHIYLNNSKFTYKGFVIFRFVIFWIAWGSIIAGIMSADLSGLIRFICIVIGISFLALYSSVKKAISRYKQLKKEKRS
ncbi:MAG: restriction endonuclease [Lachnospiraceae bacterium]|nr:restriction endonuclease [Lachnospiraceae bacterium]